MSELLTQTLFIPHVFPGLNDYTGENRKHWSAGGKQKKEWTELATAYALQLKRFEKPVAIGWTWFERDQKRDPDNIIFAKKFILDGLKNAGKIPDDNQKWILGFDYEKWLVVPGRTGVEVVIREVK